MSTACTDERLIRSRLILYLSFFYRISNKDQGSGSGNFVHKREPIFRFHVRKYITRKIYDAPNVWSLSLAFPFPLPLPASLPRFYSFDLELLFTSYVTTLRPAIRFCAMTRRKNNRPMEHGCGNRRCFLPVGATRWSKTISTRLYSTRNSGGKYFFSAGDELVNFMALAQKPPPWLRQPAASFVIYYNARPVDLFAPPRFRAPATRAKKQSTALLSPRSNR